MERKREYDLTTAGIKWDNESFRRRFKWYSLLTFFAFLSWIRILRHGNQWKERNIGHVEVFSVKSFWQKNKRILQLGQLSQLPFLCTKLKRWKAFRQLFQGFFILMKVNSKLGKAIKNIIKAIAVLLALCFGLGHHQVVWHGLMHVKGDRRLICFLKWIVTVRKELKNEEKKYAI